VVAALCCGRGTASAVPAIVLQSAAGGVTLGGSGSAATLALGGNVNGLGVGTAVTGVTRTVTTANAAYTSPLTLSLTGWGASASVTVSAYVSTAFGHAVAAITPTRCAGACAISTSVASPSAVASGQANNAAVSFTAGAVIMMLNGATTFTGADTASITFSAVDANNTMHTATSKLTISLTAQTAVELVLDNGTNGVSLGNGSTTSYQIDFGSVDGLGASAGSTGAQRSVTSTGALYSTPYKVTPGFSNFTSATTGTVKMYVSSNFSHTNLLQLQSSATGTAGSFTAVSLNSASATVLSSGATSQTALTPYLGLFVFVVNGANAFTGSDTATVTYTLVVP
jgi:hypothetical protein